MMGNTLHEKVNYENHPCNLPKDASYRKKISEGVFNSKYKNKTRPRNQYTIQTPHGNIDITTNLTDYCKERNLNRNYVKRGTKGYRILDVTPLKDMRP